MKLHRAASIERICIFLYPALIGKVRPSQVIGIFVDVGSLILAFGGNRPVEPCPNRTRHCGRSDRIDRIGDRLTHENVVERRTLVVELHGDDRRKIFP